VFVPATGQTSAMQIGHREPCPRRVRATHKGQLVVDSCEALYVWEVPYYPAWYFPIGSIDRTAVADDAVSDGAGIDGYCRIAWNAVDSWFEEDEEVFKHPRDPYHRVDVLHSRRHVRVSVGGMVVADSVAPRLLFETGLPVRYYLPKFDVRMDLLTPTSTSTVCPYKGTANYWSLSVNGEILGDVVWSYRDPVPEAAKIAGLVCFYNEKVDIEVDGVALPRPKTQFA
jgi:uncharacterized protein (DUF427 family)